MMQWVVSFSCVPNNFWQCYFKFYFLALLLDACDNSRNGTMMLNRKIAPYQCLVASLFKGLICYLI